MRITNKIKNKIKYQYKLEDSSDVIENEEYVGEIIPKNNILIKNYKDNIFETHSTNNQYQNGIIVEERNNYQFYVSGVGYTNNNILEKKNYNNLYEKQKLCYNEKKESVNNKIKTEKFFNDYYDCNNKLINIQGYSNFENEKDEDIKNYELNNNKSYCRFQNFGFLKDSSNGQLYKIYEAKPIDINNENIAQQLRNNQNYLINNYKNTYGNKNNFVMNSFYINEKKINNYTFEHPLFKKENNLKKIKNNDNKYEILGTNHKIKSLYIKNNSMSPKIFKNKDTFRKNENKQNENELYNKNKIINNNNYIEVNECSS